MAGNSHKVEESWRETFLFKLLDFSKSVSLPWMDTRYPFSFSSSVVLMRISSPGSIISAQTQSIWEAEVEEQTFDCGHYWCRITYGKYDDFFATNLRQKKIER